MDALNYCADATEGHTDLSDDMCPVCLEPMGSEGDDAKCVRLPCGHRFHFDCIVKSFQKQQTALRQCCYCRTGFGEMEFTKDSVQYIAGFHSKQSLTNLMNQCTTDIDWDSLTTSDQFVVAKGKNAFKIGSFAKLSSTKKTVTLKLKDGQRISCVCHNALKIV